VGGGGGGGGGGVVVGGVGGWLVLVGGGGVWGGFVVVGKESKGADPNGRSRKSGDRIKRNEERRRQLGVQQRRGPASAAEGMETRSGSMGCSRREGGARR